MFTNIGHKLMAVAKFLFWIGAILSIIVGIIIMASGTVVVNPVNVGFDYGAEPQRTNAIIPGILIIVVGILGSWIGSLVLYGFGKLVEDNGEMRKIMEKTKA